MTDEMAQHGAYHVLLIGIDNYEQNKHKLYGCVNDIDNIQGLLVDRAKIPASQITRLVSPHPTYVPDTTVEADEATMENIVAALSRLGSDLVGPADRVFVYYSGHGVRLKVDEGGQSAFRGSVTRLREVLAPVDFNFVGPNVLFDFELNAHLANIVERAKGKVTVILDCCHSSGATRSLDPSETNARFIDLSDEPGHDGPVTLSDERAQQLASSVPLDSKLESSRPDGSDEAFHVADCQVVAACLNHEKAYEIPKTVAEGEKRSGLLTRTLIEALAKIPDEELTTVTWGRFWNPVSAKIATHPETKPQHPKMSSGLAREWLAGPPNDGDAGLWVERVDGQANEYVINAGTIAGITKGAHIAVYGLEPFKFKRLGDEDDESARIGSLLEVTTASASQATAIAMGEPFDLPPGVRGRVVQAGDSERLLCAVIPEDDAVVAALRDSDLVELTSEHIATARLERVDDGSWVLTDDVHGANDPVLARLGPDEVVGEVRHVVEHYLRYAGPIRMAHRCGVAGDLPNALQLSVLECPEKKLKDGKIEEAEISNLRELSRETDGSYALRVGTGFCFRVRNTSKDRLLVHLYNSDASGMVIDLGHAAIDGGTVEHFWWGGNTGTPIRNTLADDQPQCIDRLTAIGTTDFCADLSHLVETGLFRRESMRGMGGPPPPPPPPPVEHWTAVDVIVRTSASA